MLTDTLDSPIGTLGVGATAHGLALVRFARTDGSQSVSASDNDSEDPAAKDQLLAAVTQLREYFDGTRHDFDLAIDWGGVDGLRLAVLEALYDTVAFGHTTTYGELAKHAHSPDASQAVGQIMGSNPVPVVVPCHRVLAADGLGGFGGGRRTKEWLLAWEGSLTSPFDLDI